MSNRSSRAIVVGLLVLAAVGVRAEDEVVVEVRAPGDGATVLAPDAGLPPSADLGDLLATTPGASVRRMGGLGAFAGVSLRGSDFRQVEVRLDGVPLNPDGIDAVDLSELPLSSFAEVRVHRGRVPAAYGATPVGGLVDLVTLGAVRPRASAGFGSWGTARAGASGGAEGRWGDALLTLEGLTTAGDFPYHDDGGTLFVDEDDRVLRRRNADRTQVSGIGRVRLTRGGPRLTLLDAVVHRDEGLPGPVGDPAERARLTTTRNLAVVQVDGDAGGAALTARAWHLFRAERLDDRAAEVGLGTAWQRDAFHIAGLHGGVRAAPLPWLGVSASVQGRYEHFARVLLGDEPKAVAPSRRGVAGLAADLRFSPHPAVALVPGFDARVLASADGRPMVAVNPGLTLEAEAGPVRLRGSGGRTFRAPDLTELFGNRGQIGGNPALRPEHAWGGDLGLGWVSPRAWPVSLRVEAAGFVREVRDRISWVQNAQRTLVPINLGRARLGGGELAVAFAHETWGGARTALSVTGSANLEDDPAYRGRALPYVPLVEVDHAVWVGWGERVSVGWTMHHTDRVAVDAANDRWQPTRTFHGVFLRGTPVARGPTLGVEVRNVGDQRTEQVPRDPLAGGGTVTQPVVDFVGYPLPGRTFWLTVAWSP